MRKPLLKARQLLLLAYLLAAVLWVVRCLVGCGVMLNYKLQGKMPQTHVDAAELVTESFAPYSSNEWWTPPDDDPAWYLSTDSDPHIYWQGQGYVETVVLDAAHRLPPGGVALYYLKPARPTTPRRRRSTPGSRPPASTRLIWAGSGSQGCALTRTAWAAYRRCLPALI